MSSLHPERFGAVTRSTEQLSTVERLANWFRIAAPLRAAASLGHDYALDCVPNIVPMRRPLTRMQVVRAALLDHCRLVGLSEDVAEDAISRCRNWLAMDTTLSSGELISKGKVRCSLFASSKPIPPSAA